MDHRDLAELGVSSALAHHDLKSGWLARLGRSVFMFPKDTHREADCVKFLARRLPGLHVGAKTALAWRGVRHNLPAREPLWLWGEQKARLPVWFSQRFRALHDAQPLCRFPAWEYWIAVPTGNSRRVLVSVPERAIIEMLSEVGIHQGIEEARHIMEGVRWLRPEVLAALLQHCRRVKVRRLCVLWAEELNLPWAEAARKAAGPKLGAAVGRPNSKTERPSSSSNG